MDRLDREMIMSKLAPHSRKRPTRSNMLPKTLTEAQAKAGYRFLHRGSNEASTGRTIPYAETYRQRTGVGIDTPEERIQKASEEQARRQQSDQ